MRQGSSPLERPWSQSHRMSQSSHELTHPVRIRQLAQVHVLDEALHEVDGDGGACGDACSTQSSVIRSYSRLQQPNSTIDIPQMAKIDPLALMPPLIHLGEHAEEVRGYAVEGCAAFFYDGVDDGWRVEDGGGVDDARAVRPCCEVAEDEA